MNEGSKNHPHPSMAPTDMSEEHPPPQTVIPSPRGLVTVSRRSTLTLNNTRVDAQAVLACTKMIKPRGNDHWTFFLWDIDWAKPRVTKAVLQFHWYEAVFRSTDSSACVLKARQWTLIHKSLLLTRCPRPESQMRHGKYFASHTLVAGWSLAPDLEMDRRIDLDSN